MLLRNFTVLFLVLSGILHVLKISVISYNVPKEEMEKFVFNIKISTDKLKTPTKLIKLCIQDVSALVNPKPQVLSSTLSNTVASKK